MNIYVCMYVLCMHLSIYLSINLFCMLTTFQTPLNIKHSFCVQDREFNL